MGLKTLDGFRADLNHALGEKRQGNERLDQWLNDAQIELFAILDIAGRRTCQQTPTVVGQEQYDVPIDLVAILVMRDQTNRRRLIKTSLENFELFEDDRDGPPTHYMRVDQEIFFYPIPDGIYLIQQFYIKEPALLELGTVTSELPSMFDRVIHMIALRNALIDLEQNDRATFIFQAAQNKIRELPTEEWLEGQNPMEGIQIAHSFKDLQNDPRSGVDDFSGRWVL